MPPDLAVRCYCGATDQPLDGPPRIVVHCHCADCRRWTGGAVGTFAAFSTEVLNPMTLGSAQSFAQGVHRWRCTDCGSPLAATFDDLPDQVYVPVGVMAGAAAFAPSLHCNHGERLPWLHLDPHLDDQEISGRAVLNKAFGL